MMLFKLQNTGVQKKCSFAACSATPSMESYYRLKMVIKALYIRKQIWRPLLPTVEIVDMSDELKAGNISLISSYMTEQLKKNILNNEQAILFLNRRGHSTFISCVECGHVVKCKNCSIPMRLHKKNNRLMCHYCGYSQKNIEKCPICNNEF
jgi:primosomal protein N' (replication factor Y)